MPPPRKARPAARAQRPHGVLAVVSELTAVGSYVCSLQLDDTHIRTLDPDQAQAYVAELTWAVTCAEYDAAVIAQLKAMELPMPEVSLVVRDLRTGRRPILDAATAPLTFTPLVSGRDFRPLINGAFGKLAWQWELDSARMHCQHVLEVVAGVEMDARYAAYLREKIGLDEEMSRGYVRALRNHMATLSDPFVTD